MSQNTMIIRADADAKIGTGHVMRSLALAQAWQLQGGDVQWVTTCELAPLIKIIEENGFKLTRIQDPLDVSSVAAIIRKKPDSVIVMDGYHLNSEYQKQMCAFEVPVLVIDDAALEPFYYADFILNPVFQADTYPYQCAESTLKLFGPRYALLRREFEGLPTASRFPEQATDILITMGGADAPNFSSRILDVFNTIESVDLNIRLIIGAANPHEAKLKLKAKENRHKVKLIGQVPNLSEEILAADVVVSAAGVTAWELAFLGVPAALVAIVDNQKDIAKGMAQSYAAVSLGSWDLWDPERAADKLTSLITDVGQRKSLSQYAKQLVDGQGCHRVIGLLNASIF